MIRRRRVGAPTLAAVAAVALLSLPAQAAPRPAASPLTFPAPSWVDTIGPVALSSPTVATIDGQMAVLFASEDGELYVVNAATGALLPGWPEPVTLSGGAPTAIESSPTVAALDGPGRPPTIIIGAGSTYAADQQGGLVAFNEDGTVRFTFHTLDVFNEWSGSASTPVPDGYDEGVFSTPAVGDITGDGEADVVFGSYDHRLYALRPNGTLVPGFPLDLEDTFWSSPSLVHVRGSRHREDIFIGGDASGRDHCYGGFVYDLSYERGRPTIVWQHCEQQTVWSSPAVGVINGSGRPAVIVGTGFGEPPPYRPGADRVYAYYAKTGARVPGWPVETAGPSFGSPAIGAVGSSGETAVVDTSWCLSCGGSPGQSMVYAWSGSGQRLWSEPLLGAEDFSSPVLADLTGSGVNDVLVGSSAGLFPLDGGTGAFLFGTSTAEAINNCSMQNAAAVALVPGAGWRLFESCGGPKELIATGRLFCYPLPTMPLTSPAWGMWRGGAAHDGVSSLGR